jgi:hypothetical protein
MATPVTPKRKASAPPQDSSARPSLAISSRITDRKSAFVALFSATLSLQEMRAHPDLKTADHRIAAWRLPSNQRTLHEGVVVADKGFDDDGEKGAGQHLLRVLEAEGIAGRFVVGRWCM